MTGIRHVRVPLGDRSYEVIVGYGAAEFLAVHEYRNVQRWADMLLERPAVKRGNMVNRISGEPSTQLHERHDAADFESKTQDKVAKAS